METQEQQPSLTKNLQQFIRAIQEIANNLLELVWLESKLAKQSLVMIAIISVLAVFLVFSTFVLLLISLTCAIHELGLNWMYSTAIVALLNIIIVTVLLKMIMHYTGYLKFKATRQSLKQLTSL